MKNELPDAEDAKDTQRTQKDIHLENVFFASSAHPLRPLRPAVGFQGFR
jgi:hypothetical protein